MSNPIAVIDAFKGKRVLVAGDAILDVYERGETERLCREAPAPVVGLQERIFSCGGASNTAVNAVALGGSVSFLTVVGDDDNARHLLERLRAGGVDSSLVIKATGRSTIAKKRICASSNILVRVDEGDDSDISVELADRVAAAIAREAEHYDVLVLSDYECGFFSDAVLSRLAQKKLSLPILVDAKQPQRFRALSPAAVKPNYEEAVSMLGIPRKSRGERVEQILGYGQQMLELTGARAVACTLDMDGTVLFERGQRPYLVSCVPQHETRTIGAGDSFVGTLALALASGVRAPAAARLAAAAAAVVLEKDGTAVCYSDELRAFFRGHDKRVGSDADLLERVAALRSRHKRIVFTNGCFDILHRGHVEFLQQARALGDALIVALNDDQGIRRIKGPGRPVNTLEDRMEVLAGLEAVDLLVAFAGDTPLELLEMVRPDVLAKGGTYSVDSLPEATEINRLGGEIEIIPFHDGMSTSELIQRMQRPPDSAAYRADRRAL